MAPRRKVKSSSQTPFDLTRAIRGLCDDLCNRLPDLDHIEMARVAVGFAQTRRATPLGIQATLTPLRFEGGAEHRRIRGRRWRMERLIAADGREFLYLLRVYLPRFQNLPPFEKLVTVLHELWHISPEFNGDLRRHPGRCYIHSGSQAEYDRQMAELGKRWLEAGPPPEVHEFLNWNFRELHARHGGVVGARIRPPRMLAS